MAGPGRGAGAGALSRTFSSPERMAFVIFRSSFLGDGELPAEVAAQRAAACTSATCSSIADAVSESVSHTMSVIAQASRHRPARSNRSY